MFIQKIKSAGVPRYKSVSRLEAQSSENGSIKFLFLHKGIRRSLTTKLLLIHQGVIPSTEISRSVGIDHSWNTSQLSFQPIIDKWGKTNIDGIVCSPHELKIANTILGSHSIKITPGIRDIKIEDDQARTMSAKEAIERGSTFLVIGRPITQAEDIAQALQNFNNSIYEK